MLNVVDGDAAREDAPAGSLLDELARAGAQQMLAAALKAEVAAYIDAHADELDEAGHRLVVRNGYHEARSVTTAAGSIPIRQPRVNDKRVNPSSGEREKLALLTDVWAGHAAFGRLGSGGQ